MLRDFLDFWTIKKSDFFDPAYYLLEYPDCRRADVDPLWHFVRFGWKEGRNPSPQFDTSYYLRKNPDVRHAGMNPLVHFIKYGQAEGRAIKASGESSLPKAAVAQPRRRTKGLRWWLYAAAARIYAWMPPRLRPGIRSWVEAHFASLLTRLIGQQNAWSHHIQRNNLHDQDFLVDLDEIEPARDAGGSIAIHLHVFYSDLAKELSAHLTHMPFPYDLFISVPDEQTKAVCQTLFHNLPFCNRVEIQTAPNRGRDVAPLFCLFGEQLRKYDYIAHLHTKKSLYNKGATIGWREYLFEKLLGSQDQIRQIFTLLRGDDPCGIVYPQNYVLLPYWANTWLANKATALAWCSRLGISEIPRGYFDYPASSMFWARSSALAPFFEAGITYEDFPEEQGQTDGTLAHTIERLFVLCVLRQGMRPAIIRDEKYPSWSSWRFDQYLGRDFLSIQKLFNSPQVRLIGFDVFDTLLTRPLLDPESVKKIVAERAANQTGMLYEKFRVLAENHARQAKGLDVDLHEIFAAFKHLTGLSDSEVNQLKELEIQVEAALLEPRQEGIQFYQSALSTKKPVAILTDMFLPKTHIQALLQENQIDGYDRLLVSADIGLRKDDGRLYDYALKQYGVLPSQFLMVGDNERSDVQIPCDMGSQFVHLLRPVELARGLPRFSRLITEHEQANDLNAELSLGLVVQKNFSPVQFNSALDPASLIPVTPYQIGYSLVGTMLVSFAAWLVKQSAANQICRLYFLSREGKLIKDIFDCWTAGLRNVPVSEYLVVSRRAAGVAAIENFGDMEDIAKTIYYPNTIENFLHTRFGLTLSEKTWQTLSQSTGWHAQKEVSVQNQKIGHLLPLLREVEGEILVKRQQERAALLRYLQEKGMAEDDHQAVVDIGYGGSVQMYLNKLLPGKVHGYYLMTDERSSKVTQTCDVTIKGCFYENVNRSNNLPTMYRFNFDLEKLMSSTDPQLEYYDTDEQGQVVGKYRELEPLEIQAHPIREAIRQGALDYAADARKIRDRVYPAFEPSTWTAKCLIESFLTNRSSSEVEFLSQIVLDDHYCGRGLVNY